MAGRLSYAAPVPIFRLPREVIFPDPSMAEPDGLLAVGGDLTPERLLTAYAEGIFPWYGDDSPILWWSPDPRLVLEPDALHVSRSLQRTLRRGTFRLTADAAFGQVIRRCATRERPGQDGTWITAEMIAAYEGLHQLAGHLVVEHGQVAPAGDEKGARDRHASPTVPSNPPR